MYIADLFPSWVWGALASLIAGISIWSWQRKSKGFQRWRKIVKVLMWILIGAGSLLIGAYLGLLIGHIKI